MPKGWENNAPGGALQGGTEFCIFRGFGQGREIDVKADDPRSCRVQAIDCLRMNASPERPLVNALQACGVDLDNMDFTGRGARAKAVSKRSKPLVQPNPEACDEHERAERRSHRGNDDAALSEKMRS